MKLQNAVNPNFPPETPEMGSMHFQRPYTWLSVWQTILSISTAVRDRRSIQIDNLLETKNCKSYGHMTDYVIVTPKW